LFLLSRISCPASPRISCPASPIADREVWNF
jgi:hypothetical protein